MKNIKIIDSVPQLPDQSVSCPICRQEFWGYSEIIYCKCGWTFVKEEMSRFKRSPLRSVGSSAHKGSKTETRQDHQSHFRKAKTESTKTKGLMVIVKD